MFRHLTAAAVFAACLAAAPAARAGFQYTFGPVGDMAVGDTQVVSVFLTYQGSPPATNTLAGSGLKTADSTLRRLIQAGGGVVAVVNPTLNGGVFINPDFN